MHRRTFLTVAAAGLTQTRTSNPPRRFLFVGNSLTYSQGGIYTHFERMAAAANPPLKVETDNAVAGGQYFKTLWEKHPHVRQAIARGHDVVVLQEDLPETTVADFREYARRFVPEIRKTGARPVLLMAWAYKRLGWISMAQIAQEHREAGRELNVDVAPVGLAWERSVQQRPDLDLFARDREHPSMYGTYLATAVVYATVFGTNPTDIGFIPPAVSAEDGRFLRRVAWETVQEYQKSR